MTWKPSIVETWADVENPLTPPAVSVADEQDKPELVRAHIDMHFLQNRNDMEREHAGAVPTEAVAAADEEGHQSRVLPPPNDKRDVVLAGSDKLQCHRKCAKHGGPSYYYAWDQDKGRRVTLRLKKKQTEKWRR